MKPLQYAGLVLILLLFGLLGWPTLYDVQRNSSAGVRTNRVTGCRDYLSVHGTWERQPDLVGRCLTPELIQAAKVRAAQEAAQAAADRQDAARIKQAFPLYLINQMTFTEELSAQATSGLNLLDQFGVKVYNSTACELTGLIITLIGLDYRSRELDSGRIKPGEVGTFLFSLLDPQEAGSGRQPWNIKLVKYASPGSVEGDPACALIRN